MKAVQIKKSITNNEREMETKPDVKYIMETINELLMILALIIFKTSQMLVYRHIR